MDTTYDEDITRNPFFVELQNEHAELLQQCIANEWIVCVPRVGTFLTHIFTLQDFLGHVLVSNDELPETHFMTLTEKTVRVINRVISIDQNDAGLPLEIHILFDETFYTEDHTKYKILCVEAPLEPAFQLKGANVSSYSTLATLHDCIDFLWTESCGKDVLENMDTAIQEFKKRSLKQSHLSLNKLMDAAASLYTDGLQIAFKNKRLKDNSRLCKNVMDNVKLAVETYLLQGTYKQVFEAIGACMAYEDSSLNKVIRNLSDVQLRDLDVKHHFNQCIPVARKNLSRIQDFNSILGKVGCIKRTVAAIKKCGDSQKRELVTSDELLPVFIFLVIKSGIPNWLTHLTFMKHFRFSVNANFQSDEVSFYISTLEAVIEHIRAGLLISSPLPESHCPFEDDYVNENFEMVSRQRKCSSTESGTNVDLIEPGSLQFLFEQVKLSYHSKVKEILETNGKLYEMRKNEMFLDDSFSENASLSNFDLRKALSIEEVLNEDDAEKPLELCHPLCTCSKCERLLSRNLLLTSPTVFSCDGHGFTVLHIACIYGRPKIVELIIEMGADVNITDYNGATPLHYTASRGHQNALLLLLHAGSDINKQNMDKNTPLHLASNNGHDCCVKAMIYFNEHCEINLNVNAVNDNGDTPLHLASKWGYEVIARLLLEYKADPWIKNAKGKTPIDLAHSSLMLGLLLSHSPNLNEYVHIINVDANYNTDHIKSEVDSLYLSDKIIFTDTAVSDDVKKLIPSSGGVKPNSTIGIRQIERLFRAISYDDTKLACFYMNINISNGISAQTEIQQKTESQQNGKCHPLCSCQKCVGSKTSQVSKPSHFNLNTCDSQGNVALHIAARFGRIEICQILVRNGAILDLQNKNGMSPLHVAVQENKISVVRLLLKRSANVGIKDNLGNTPLHYACTTGNVDVCKLIIETGTSTKDKNVLGRTPLDIANDRMYLTIISLLEQSLQ